MYKTSNIYLLIILLITISSCLIKNKSTNKLNENIDTLNNTNAKNIIKINMTGIWKLEDDYYGSIFLIFKSDNELEIRYTEPEDELGNIIENCYWDLKENQISVFGRNNSIGNKIKIIKINDDNSYLVTISKDTNSIKLMNRLDESDIKLIFNNYNEEIQNSSNYNANGVIVVPNATTIESSRETHTQWVNCKFCHGSGQSECHTCHGKGQISMGNGSAFGNSAGFHMENCYTCGGSGKYGDCFQCQGRGQVLVSY